jgi:hypothetical protein
MITRSRGVAVLVGAFALTIAAQFPALAETYAHTDARHDVEKAPQNTRSALYRKADITHVKIAHWQKAIRFTVRLRSASLKGVKFRSLGFTVKTPSHTFTGAWIAGHGSAQYLLSDETGSDVNCAESSGRAGRTIWLRLDRACLSNPRWIRASVQVGTNDGTSAWGDNALSSNWRRTYDAVFSPRILPSTR